MKYEDKLKAIYSIERSMIQDWCMLTCEVFFSYEAIEKTTETLNLRTDENEKKNPTNNTTLLEKITCTEYEKEQLTMEEGTKEAGS